MNRNSMQLWTVVAATTALAMIATSGRADEKKLGWSGEAGLSYVAVDGNSKSESLGLNGKWVYDWAKAAFVLETGGVRAESTAVFRSAFGASVNDFDIVETEIKTKTAENYFLRGRYDQQISDRLLWFAGAGWEQNEFAGFDSRSSLVAGLGKIWIANDQTKFRTDVGLTYTLEEPTALFLEDSDFLGARLGWDFSHQLTPSTKISNVLALDTNFDESDDWRADDTTSLSVAISERLALQLGLRLLYDHQPGLERVLLILASGRRDVVFIERDDLDSTFTTSLVWKF